MAKGDFAVALVWTAEALKRDPKDSLLRWRAGNLIRQIPLRQAAAKIAGEDEEPPNRALLRTMTHDNSVEDAVFSPEGRAIATASWDRTARVWSTPTGEPLTPSLSYPEQVQSAVFSPDGRSVIATSYGSPAHVWDAATGKLLPPELAQDHVRSAAFSPDGKIVATASDDYSARLWDVATGRLLAPPLRHALNVRHVAFSPDGRMLLTACWDKAARVWDISPIDWPVEDIATFAAIASAARVAQGSALEPLSRAEVDGLTKPFRLRHPELFVAP